jgi:hypothetical protein
MPHDAAMLSCAVLMQTNLCADRTYLSTDGRSARRAHNLGAGSSPSKLVDNLTEACASLADVIGWLRVD